MIITGPSPASMCHPKTNLQNQITQSFDGKQEGEMGNFEFEIC